MISASEIHELRFEKAAFGYKQEDIDEFLNRLEEEVDAAQRELEDSNNKIQVLADKVREYMRDEDALKDALLGAQKEGHRIIAEANAKADDIIAKAKAKADHDAKILSKAKKLGIPDSRIDEGFNLSDDATDEAIDTYLSKVANNYKALLQPQFGGSYRASEGEPTKEDVDNVAASLVQSL